MCGSATMLDDDALFGFTIDDTKSDGTRPALFG